MPLIPVTPDLTPGVEADVDGAQGRAPFRVETVRRQFDRHASGFGRVDAVVREVERRMGDRLSYIRIDPNRIVDVGCGGGASRTLLASLYPRAQWFGVDLSLRMLLGGRGSAGADPGRIRAWWSSLASRRDERGSRVCADAERLPLRDATADLLFSNLMLHWHPAPHRLFPEFRRVLADGGLLMFSCFGPDTLAELRLAFREAQLRSAAMRFVDMHDFGDMLVTSGFATPVMDAERLTLTYPSARSLVREVALLGGNPHEDRAPGLPAGRAARALLEALDARRDADGRIALTFEVAYGHAWKPAASEARRGADGTVAVPLERVREQLGRRRAR
jgi:malonyl-CoA O-methyltransferase